MFIYECAYDDPERVFDDDVFFLIRSSAFLSSRFRFQFYKRTQQEYAFSRLEYHVFFFYLLVYIIIVIYIASYKQLELCTREPKTAKNSHAEKRNNKLLCAQKAYSTPFKCAKIKFANFSSSAEIHKQ